MKKFFLCMLFAAVAANGFCQTKRIAHRSHSGKNNTFTIAGIDNFGETPEMVRRRQAEKAKADSAAKKAVTDSLAKIGKLQPVPKIKDKNKNKNKSKVNKYNPPH